MESAIRKLLPNIQENIVLASHTTYRVGGPARYFFVAKKDEEVVKALRIADKLRMPWFILGGGSNLLVSDKGFRGLVIKIKNTKYKIQDTNMYVEAGVAMPQLVKITTRRGLGGFEWAGGLPGTVGGAIRGNAGAFGGEMKDGIVEVKVLDREGNIKIFSRDECNFAYRSSIFKEKGFVVLSAKIQLVRGDKQKFTQEAEGHILYRKERHPLEYANAGSMFKNCDCNLFSKSERARFNHVVKTDPFPVIPTAFLLSETGVKDLRVGGAVVSEKHPNFIVNMNNAKANDIVQLSEIVQRRVKEKFGVKLEREIQFVGMKD